MPIRTFDMGSSPAPTRSQRPGLAVAALRGLLEISRLTRCQTPLQEVLERIASIVGLELEFALATIYVFRPETDDYEVVAVHGSPEDRRSLLGRVRSTEMLAPLLDPRFERFGAFFIPEGAFASEPDIGWYVSQPPIASDHGEASWRVDDALVVPLLGTAGRRLGMLAVDHPASGRRPDDPQLEVLAVFSAHAALAIESSRQVRELEAAVARNRAVLASTLDCVIAIDARGCVIELNPAAERTFGYSSEEAIGRELVELLVPESERAAVRRRFIEGLAPDGHLIGRRAETTVVRADGAPLPIEYAVTRVQEGGAEGPTYYGFVRDISERRRTEAELAHLAYHDSLTGLPNRAEIERQLDLALARARRNGSAVALMFIDLDDFKTVNDRLGHATGDRFLAAVATRLRSVLRDADGLARQGGDEFLVLLSDLAEDPAGAAAHVGEKLLRALREPLCVAGRQLRTGASIGVGLYPSDAADKAALLRHADAAMYSAKAAGGGRLHRHDPGRPALAGHVGPAPRDRRGDQSPHPGGRVYC